MANLIRQEVINFFNSENWRFSEEEDTENLFMTFQGQTDIFPCYARVRSQEQQFIFYCICPVKVAEDQTLGVAEFLHRANFGLVVGNFEFDVETGDVRFKTSIDVEGTNINQPLIKTLVYNNVLTTERYFPGLRKVMEGSVTPRTAVSEIEAN